MKNKTIVNKIKTGYGINHLSIALKYATISLVLLFIAIPIQAQSGWPKIVASKDGTPISYEVYGSGEPTLVFVHGWSCDARYWRNQISEFSENNKVVLIDLAGHGHSGTERKNYTMKSFGEDVQAVVEATKSQNVILIGHSMGGAVIAEAARLMPKRVKGLIGVDTFDNIEYPLSQEEYNMMTEPMRKNFMAGTRQFVQQMLSPETNNQLREWIMADMAAAQPSIALSAMDNYMEQSITGDAATMFDEIRIPVTSVNCDLWPINYKANRKHMLSYEAIVIKGADHFLMMNKSSEFNNALKKAIKSIFDKE